jgi:hypothetical protein
MAMMKRLTLTLLLLAGNASASIVVSNLNNDLLLQVENPITFELTGAVSTSRLGFLLPGAIDVSGSGGFSIISDAASEPTLGGPGFFSGDPDLGLLRGGQDLEILYFLPSLVDLDAGDRVTLTAGELVLPNFFAYSIINGLNYNIATGAILSATSGVPISELTSTVVPIPGAIFLFSSAIIMLFAGARVRKNK